MDAKKRAAHSNETRTAWAVLHAVAARPTRRNGQVSYSTGVTPERRSIASEDESLIGLECAARDYYIIQCSARRTYLNTEARSAQIESDEAGLCPRCLCVLKSLNSVRFLTTPLPLARNDPQHYFAQLRFGRPGDCQNLFQHRRLQRIGQTHIGHNRQPQHTHA